MSMMFAVLQIADFPLQAVLRLERDLHRQPVALLDDGRRPPLITACTATARAAGVEPGQTAPQALARCARLTLRVPRPEAEVEARASLLAAAFSLSPAVEATAPGVCTINVAGLAEEQREPALRAALRQLEELGLNATSGLGSTPLLALYAARRTDSLLRVRDGKAFLAALPLAAAEPTEELAEILAGWGIHTLGEFTTLSKGEVTHRLGPPGLALWERAAGETSRPLHLVVPAQTFAARLDCEYELETTEPLLFILRRFADRLALDLANASLAARELRLTLGLSDETEHAHAIRLPEPTTKPEIIFRTLHSYLENLRTAAPIVAVGLSIEPVRMPTRQQGLFDCALRDPHGFAETLARASAIVGADRVGAPRVENTHRPDAFALGAPAATLNFPSGCFRHEPRGLALWRYRPPLPAVVEWMGGSVAYLRTSQAGGFVREIRGAWQGSGNWWEENEKWEREEWDVELEEGGLYRIVRTPAGWFLEGEYD